MEMCYTEFYTNRARNVEHACQFFDVLLTVHLSIYTSIINQLDAKSLFYNKFISCFYMFRVHVLIVRSSKLYYTAFGIISRIGGRPVHGRTTYRCDDTRGCIIQF